MEISIETTIEAPLVEVWSAWITPKDITNWNFPTDDWSCPAAKIDFTVGGKFSYRMEAKDGSMGFDFDGTFTAIEPHKRIKFVLADDRKVKVFFEETEQGIRVVEMFEVEDENSAELQRQGWQSILNNFKKHVEAGV